MAPMTGLVHIDAPSNRIEGRLLPGASLVVLQYTTQQAR
jgi:hypothetical protein